jgi:hypothetical protein
VMTITKERISPFDLMSVWIDACSLFESCASWRPTHDQCFR